MCPIMAFDHQVPFSYCFFSSVLQRNSPSAAKVSAKLHTKPINRIFLQNLNNGIKFAFADMRGYVRSFGRPGSPWDSLESQGAKKKPQHGI